MIACMGVKLLVGTAAESRKESRYFNSHSYPDVGISITNQQA